MHLRHLPVAHRKYGLIISWKTESSLMACKKPGFCIFYCCVSCVRITNPIWESWIRSFLPCHFLRVYHNWHNSGGNSIFYFRNLFFLDKAQQYCWLPVLKNIQTQTIRFLPGFFQKNDQPEVILKKYELDVVIIGGGLAGLSAAFELLDNNKRYWLLKGTGGTGWVVLQRSPLRSHACGILHCREGAG